jgi:hypothetical protein
MQLPNGEVATSRPRSRRRVARAAAYARIAGAQVQATHAPASKPSRCADVSLAPALGEKEARPGREYVRELPSDGT